MTDILTPQLLINAYSQGYFPMADENGEIYWHNPDPRAIMPLDKIKMPRSLRQYIKKNKMIFRIDTNFEQLIRKCADRDETWINDEIIRAYINFHYLGYAHSVETYIEERMVGGLYGVALGKAFFGESMFSDVSNASKAAFYFLVERLKELNFVLLDSQYLNPHTKLLGAIEISKDEYMKLLNKSLNM